MLSSGESKCTLFQSILIGNFSTENVVISSWHIGIHLDAMAGLVMLMLDNPMTSLGLQAEIIVVLASWMPKYSLTEQGSLENISCNSQSLLSMVSSHSLT